MLHSNFWSPRSGLNLTNPIKVDIPGEAFIGVPRPRKPSALSYRKQSKWNWDEPVAGLIAIESSDGPAIWGRVRPRRPGYQHNSHTQAPKPLQPKTFLPELPDYPVRQPFQRPQPKNLKPSKDSKLGPYCVPRARCSGAHQSRAARQPQQAQMGLWRVVGGHLPGKSGHQFWTSPCQVVPSSPSPKTLIPESFQDPSKLKVAEQVGGQEA